MSGRPGTVPEWWTMAYPQLTSVPAATAYLDQLGGSISRTRGDSDWVLYTGEQALFEAQTEEELDGFVLGFALAQSIAARFGPLGSTPPASPAADGPPVGAETAEAEILEGEIVEGEIVEGDVAVEGDVLQGDVVVEGDVLEGEAFEGDVAVEDGVVVEGDVLEDGVSVSGDEGEAIEGEAPRDDAPDDVQTAESDAEAGPEGPTT